jgi:hypothetical protein
MRRFSPLDIFLLATLTPLWGLCFALYLHNVLRGELARIPVYISAAEDKDHYPVVRGFRPGTVAENRDLALGDQLLRIGETDLRGVSSLGFVARVYRVADSALKVPVTILRAGHREEAWLNLSPLASSWGMAPVTFAFAAMAVFVLLRVPGSRLARTFFVTCLTYSLQWTVFYGGPFLQTYAWAVVDSYSSLVMFPLMLRVLFLFPEELAPSGARMPLWPWLFGIISPISTSLRFGVPVLPPIFALRAYFAVTALFLIVLLVVLTRLFRRTGPFGRRQLKWVVYGLYVGSAPVLVADVLTTFSPSLWRVHDVAIIALVLIPLCVLIAIVRANLFDIDRLINATAAYSLLLVLLTGVVLLLGPRLAQAVSSVTGIQSTSGQVLFSLGLVVAATPLYRHLRLWIERVFFPERYALARGVHQLLAELPTCPDAQALLALTTQRLTTLLQPECCVLYERIQALYTPTFTRGSVVPLPFDVQSPLVGALQTRAMLIDNDRWERTTRSYLEAGDRTVLDNLRASAVLPIGLSEPPDSFLCLGPKRSGDVYTQTDHALLAEVASQVSSQLALATRAVTPRPAV